MVLKVDCSAGFARLLRLPPDFVAYSSLTHHLVVDGRCFSDLEQMLTHYSFRKLAPEIRRYALYVLARRFARRELPLECGNLIINQMESYNEEALIRGWTPICGKRY